MDSHIKGINERLALILKKVEGHGKELAEIKRMLEKLFVKAGTMAVGRMQQVLKSSDALNMPEYE